MLSSTIRYSVILLGVSVAAAVWIDRSPPVTGGAEIAKPAPPAASMSASQGLADEVVLDAGPHGHFFVDAEVNGETIRFMVDTGASQVALTLAAAERLGLDPSQLQFDGRVRTANGIARIAHVVLDEIEIDDNSVRDVAAAVIDSPMEISLLGMSFLSRLAGYEVRGRQLILRW